MKLDGVNERLAKDEDCILVGDLDSVVVFAGTEDRCREVLGVIRAAGGMATLFKEQA